MKCQYLAVTLPGLEDVMEAEIEELIGVSARPAVPGKARFSAEPEKAIELVYGVRSANRILLLVGEGEVDPKDLASIGKVAREVDWCDYFDPDMTFAVRAERAGSHTYRSPDIAAEVGAAVVEHFLERSGERIRANLKSPDVTVRAYVSGSVLLLGIDLVGESLHKRRYRVYQHPASLSPVVAYSLIRLTGWLAEIERDPSSPLVDPMCGGGTIPIEAALAAKKIPPGTWRRAEGWPFRLIKPFRDLAIEEILDGVDGKARPDFRPVIFASDVSPKHVAGAARNAVSAGVQDSITFSVFSAEFLPERVDRIGALSTNPPYELRTGRRRDIVAAFRGLAKALAENLELKASAILGGPALPKFERAMSLLRLEERRTVRYGGVDAAVLVYSRP